MVSFRSFSAFVVLAHSVTGDSVPSFDERAAKGVEQVTKLYPGAVLMVAEAAADEATADAETFNRTSLVKLTFNFSGKSDDGKDDRVIYLNEESMGNFGEPQESPRGEHWGGVASTSLPIKMDLAEAKKLKDAVKFTEPFRAVSLVTPLNPEYGRPTFFFYSVCTRELQPCPIVTVDTVKKTVEVESFSVPSFNQRVDMGVKEVTHRYPGAVLMVAEAEADEATADAETFNLTSKVKLIFNLNGKSDDGKDDRVIYLNEESMGNFGEPKEIHNHWGGVASTSWPIKMDLAEAKKLKDEAEFTQPFRRVSLNTPLIHTYGTTFFFYSECATGLKGAAASQARCPIVTVDTKNGNVEALNSELSALGQPEGQSS